MMLFVNDKLPVFRHSFGRDEHGCTGRVVVELNRGPSSVISLEVRLPIKCSSEILRRWQDGVVLHLECCRDVESFEVCTSETLLLESEQWMLVHIENHGIVSLKVLCPEVGLH